MNLFSIKLSLIVLLTAFFSSGLHAGRMDATPNTVDESDPIEISYNDLPPFVKEFIYKGYKVEPEDVKKIIKIRNGAYFIKLKRSVNVFGINAQLKMHQQELDFFDIRADILKLKQKQKSSRISEKRERSKTIRTLSNETEVTWSAIPRNVQEYLIKKMDAKEDQIYKAFKLRNGDYKIILKKAHDEFVIFEDHPERIAFDDAITDLLDE